MHGNENLAIHREGKTIHKGGNLKTIHKGGLPSLPLRRHAR